MACHSLTTPFFSSSPQTKGRTLEEINEMFLAGVPARKWAKYRTRTQEMAQESHQQQGPDGNVGGAGNGLIGGIPATANTIEGAAVGKPVADASVEMVEDVAHHGHRHHQQGQRASVEGEKGDVEKGY